MGYPNDLALASLRLSLSRYNTVEEVQTIVEATVEAVQEVRARRWR
jgi:cysteine sulfinate desulfinase/cysteine desulfurase-like protein